MWSVSPPPASVSEAARTCAQGVRDKDLARRIRHSCPQFEANSAALRHAVTNHQLHTVTSTNYAVADLEDSELKKLYTQQMAKVRRPGRVVYSAIMAQARRGLCSYCQYGVALTLDHFVPKGGVPALSIDPWNLIPCCRDCNSVLLDEYATDETEQFFHPYDLPPLGRWLHAEINHSQPVTASFYVQLDTGFPESIRRRAVHQFAMLRLDEKYAIVSAPEIAETTRSLVTHLAVATAEEISQHLQSLADSAFALDANSRRAVALEALAKDDWYCTSGFLG